MLFVVLELDREPEVDKLGEPEVVKLGDDDGSVIVDVVLPEVVKVLESVAVVESDDVAEIEFVVEAVAV